MNISHTLSFLVNNLYIFFTDLDPSHQLTESDIHERQLSEQIGLKWKDLARKLGFLQGTINMIEEEKRHITKECCTELLLQWINCMGREATIGKLQDALERVKSKNVVENLISGKQREINKYVRRQTHNLACRLISRKIRICTSIFTHCSDISTVT